MTRPVAFQIGRVPDPADEGVEGAALRIGAALAGEREVVDLGMPREVDLLQRRGRRLRHADVQVQRGRAPARPSGSQEMGPRRTQPPRSSSVGNGPSVRSYAALALETKTGCRCVIGVGSVNRLCLLLRAGV